MRFFAIVVLSLLSGVFAAPVALADPYDFPEIPLLIGIEKLNQSRNITQTILIGKDSSRTVTSLSEEVY